MLEAMNEDDYIERNKIIASYIGLKNIEKYHLINYIISFIISIIMRD